MPSGFASITWSFLSVEIKTSNKGEVLPEINIEGLKVKLSSAGWSSVRVKLLGFEVTGPAEKGLEEALYWMFKIY